MKFGWAPEQRPKGPKNLPEPHKLQQRPSFENVAPATASVPVSLCPCCDKVVR